MALWGSLFPCIKIGYDAFSIKGNDVASILMFAGTRFTVCGIIICAIAFFKKDKIESPKTKHIFIILLVGVFAYICTASMIAYLLWNYILKTSDLSNMFIIKFAEPLFACLFGAILLGENIFQWQYLIGFILISLGIILANKKSTLQKETQNLPKEK